jgi:hypothetical protein
VTLVAVPAEITAEAIATALVEVRLIADLHTVHGRALPTEPRARGIALVQAWADQRGVRPADMGTLPRALGASTRRRVRHRLLIRLMRNLGSFTPLLVGAAIGSRLNRKETRRLADNVRRDLAAMAHVRA